MERRRFIDLWQRAPAPGPAPDPAPVFRELERRYSEPHRLYHTADHLDHCLGQLDAARELAQSPDGIEMALWFHDAIYDPSAKDNEQRSAELFVQRTGDGFETDFVETVFDHIMATEHVIPPEPFDGQLITDIDLSAIGLPWEEFQRDSNAIRREFAHLSDAQYHPPHAQFLRALLARPSVYYTDFFRERYEQPARANMERYLDELSDAGII
jgi:predicted metal-dependent HD superfamily phosphohydrolase